MSPPLTNPLRTFCWGVLPAIGMFDPGKLTDEDMQADPAGYRTWFGLGEVFMACLLAGIIAVPAGIWFAGWTELSLAFIGASVMFLPLFVFLRVRKDPKVEKNAKAFFDSCPGSSGTP
ncbi:MAG: hypothetical protein M0R30_12420 [Methanoregula sp.]|jgi:hypothetical protein|uniref:hypothetical protein n=1 Tax=Methanoregula sp. TaxID=2052170 RepID=UPI0025F37B3C|nr:hypothetical protein [Methanoregula sp.]MCK9632429.1 hypothetical protein [Methanoregula sp.]